MEINRTDLENSGTSGSSEQNRSNNLRDSGKNKNHEHTEEEFPGYPHYPAKEDIMHPANRLEKISADPENLTRSGSYLDTKNIEKPVSTSMDTAMETDDDLLIVPGTEADVTKEDLLILGELDLEDEDEEGVDKKVLSGDLTSELDVPGDELDDANEDLGEEDEENNYYSLGGDRQDNLEEN